MRVQFKIEGGLAAFPGLSKPRVIDGADLSTAEADRLSQLIDAANFFDLPAEKRSLAKGAADYQQYTITVEDGRRRRTVRVADPIEDPHLQSLVDYLREQTAPGAQKKTDKSQDG